MFRRGFIVFRILMTILVIGALAVGGLMLFRAGQAQGYALGLAAASSSGTAVQPAAPVMPYYPGYYFHPPFFFFPFGGLFGLLFFGFLFFGLIGRAFRFHAWRAGGPHGYPPHWAKDWQADPSQAKEPDPKPETK